MRRSKSSLKKTWWFRQEMVVAWTGIFTEEMPRSDAVQNIRRIKE